MPDPLFLLALVGLGAFVGLAAGLLGIGGGGLMVPILSSLFLWQGYAPAQVVHLALGTSMAAIIATSLASLRAHHKKAGVVWPVVGAMAPGVVLGGFAATFVVVRLNSVFLAALFAVFMLGVAIQLASGKSPRPDRVLPGRAILALVGSGIGAISAMVSIGGGTLSVPYLFWHNLPMKKAIGTSAALGLPIALSGTAGYLLNGWDAGVDGGSGEQATLGYIYWPGVLVISLLSTMFAPLGVRLAYYLPVPQIKKIFALLLVMLSAKMVFLLLLA